MLYAIQSLREREKILPNKKGENGFCPLCDSQVSSVCGEMRIKHWRHKNSFECDSWNKEETEWHRQWKERFPKEFCEVTVVLNNEKHRADVKLENGLVIEFQNSTIADVEILKRENFYKKMIWVINAENFQKMLRVEEAEMKWINEPIGQTHELYIGRKSAKKANKINDWKAEEKKFESDVQDLNTKLLEYETILSNKDCKNYLLNQIGAKISSDNTKEINHKTVENVINVFISTKKDKPKTTNGIKIETRRIIKSITRLLAKEQELQKKIEVIREELSKIEMELKEECSLDTYEKELFRVKKDSKGLFYINWTIDLWRNPTIPIFLDFQDFIFEKVQDKKCIFRRISKEDFITSLMANSI